MIELKRLNVHRIVATEEEANHLASLGFSILQTENKDGGKSINDMTLKELQEYCNAKGYENYSKLKKEKLIVFIEEQTKVGE